MASARSLVAKASNVGLAAVVIALVLECSCVANGEFPGGRRALSASGDPTVFDITQYGAKGDGSTDSFKAFLSAWIQVCESSVPAKLVVPKGTFLTGPTVFAGPCKSQVTVEVQGTVKATPGVAGYATPEWILFERVDNLVLNGGGTFDGQGEIAWRDHACKKRGNCKLPPTSIKFRRMNNTEVHHITSVNSKAFHMFLVKTINTTIHNVNLIAPDTSPNTDGIHLSNADFVKILDSNIGTGDDCVSVGRGSNNVTVERVICGPGHGFSIGSLGKYKGEEDVTGVTIRNCTMNNTDNGARIKTWGGSDASKASDIVFEDIIMNNVKNPIIIDQEYGTRGGASRVEISNVKFKNIRGTTITKEVVQFVCSSLVPCKEIKVVDVNLAYTGKPLGRKAGGSIVGAICNHADIIFGGRLNFPLCPA
ncbi:PREDICTED: exopolygalacturonase clone GBGE184-like [Tarenaya hassleriana]|uniref:exopolygalacturonase clone GBGE184-like n=1 Tax=Tarenaya hassleriana TaxID=28532 RepID=UPI00053C25D0|nr:PREDICTED: exopolygalacturonase clone GBGE184-like [Tarenaya hassleriana]